jgi:DNA polymerase-3 subunit delta
LVAKDPVDGCLGRIRRGDIPSVLFLYGEDQGRIRSFVTALRKACLQGASEAFNLNRLDAQEVPMERVLEAARTLPILAPRRLVLVANASGLSTPEWNKVLSYLQDPSPHTCLVFLSERLPEPKEIQKAMGDKGVLLRFRPRTVKDAGSWVTSRFQQEGKRIRPEAVALLLERAGTGEGELEIEIQKILCYVGDSKEVSAEDVAQVGTDIRPLKLFDLTDALAEYRTAQALRILHRLMEEGTHPLALLGMLLRQIRLLWQARESLHKGREEISKELNLPLYQVDRLRRAAKLWEMEELWEAYQGLVDMDRTLKSGGLPPKTLLERWILQRKKEGRHAPPSTPAWRRL